MLPAISALFERRQLRLRLMKDLLRSLEEGQTSLLGPDPQVIKSNAGKQQAILDQISILNAQSFIRKAHASLHELLCEDGTTSSGFTAEAGAEQQWKAMTQELKTVEARVRHLALVHAAVIRQARKTIEVMSQILSSAAPTYAPPGLKLAAAMGQEK
jgi:preprotein translocase subunit SecD